MKFSTFLIIAIIIFFEHVKAQIDITYQMPPREILEIADAPLPPSVLIDDDNKNIVLLYRNNFKSIADLSEPEMRLAGLRINPAKFIDNRINYYSNIALMKVGEKEEIKVNGIPDKPRLAYFEWSPDQTKMAFTNTSSDGVELWLLDIGSATASRTAEPVLNASMGKPFGWFPNSDNLLVKMVPKDNQPLIDKSLAIPTGPRISVSEGTLAQNRTFQDLLEDKADEHNFEQLVRSEIYKVNITGKKSIWKTTAIFSRFNISPDGEYVLCTLVKKPFSYIVPYDRFPSSTVIYDKHGMEVKVLAESPLLEDMPKGFMATQKGIRNINWRNDMPASVYYVVALDDGDPSMEVDYRDEIFSQEAPFSDPPVSVLKTFNRFAGITWGDSETAVAYDQWWNTRNAKTYLFNPSDKSDNPEIIFDRNYQDNYNNPGSFLTKKNDMGVNTLVINKGTLYLTGPGYSPEGIRPFFREFNIKTKESNELWRADGKNSLEQIVEVVDPSKGLLITRIESSSDYPNYFMRNIRKNSAQQLTFFKNPFMSLEGVHKEVISYKRNDGIELSATLYLPAGYNMEEKQKLPLLMWAYPREYKDASTAGQVTTSPHRFTYPNYGSPVFWVTRGYAILDETAFPVVGEGDNQPNDTYREQLVDNAKAAIDAVCESGYIDRSRVAVGGHSYGAFMTANLLTHSDLFAAGIARSGAYNRTLTPFGFQAEERTYWEAPEVYYNMSPFMHADKMKTPVLLIHGEDDNNAGTFPLQSERYFNALKGMGAPARLVFLPKESHGYAARESVMHMLWEQDQWLEKWVKIK
jgi:dipeptidyl aminopeptidase/acylaminoacyl peptidase